MAEEDSYDDNPMETSTLFSETDSIGGEDTDTMSEIISNSHPLPTNEPSEEAAKSALMNFILLSILFSANHGAVVSCLSLASARLGDLGSMQNSILYFSYTFSALFGATYIIKRFGPKTSLIAGMWIYCIYVGCFVLATTFPAIKEGAVLVGGFIGGLGGGFLWTAQGSYFARAAQEYASLKLVSVAEATSLFAGIFAGIYLAEEVIMRLFSSLMIETLNWSWSNVFVGYTIISVTATIAMFLTVDYKMTEGGRRSNSSQSSLYKATVTFRMLISDPKMKYMIPLCAVFGLSSVFVITFVSSEVVRLALNDENSIYIGVLTSVTSAVAGVMSVVFGFVSRKIGNGIILIIGCVSFFMVSFLFFVVPDLDRWGMFGLLLVYALQGLGRSTFEGALKAEFAVVFTDKEGAFGNIIFQNGIFSSFGFFIATSLTCANQSTYCIQYSDGHLHNILVLEILIMASAVLAVAGYWRARKLYKLEQERTGELEERLIEEVIL
jgi:MFS family permease